MHVNAFTYPSPQKNYSTAPSQRLDFVQDNTNEWLRQSCSSLNLPLPYMEGCMISWEEVQCAAYHRPISTFLGFQRRKKGMRQGWEAVLLPCPTAVGRSDSQCRNEGCVGFKGVAIVLSLKEIHSGISHSTLRKNTWDLLLYLFTIRNCVKMYVTEERAQHWHRLTYAFLRRLLPSRVPITNSSIQPQKVVMIL